MIGFIKNWNKRNKILAAIVAGILILAGGLFAYSAFQSKPHEEVHLHAGFQVYIDDKQIDFSNNKYMYFLPCGVDSAHQKNLNDKVHLHDKVGDVAHVHAAGMKWKDLFEAIKYDLPYTEDTKYIKDGVEVENLLEQEIQNNESVIFVFDGEKKVEEYVKDQVSVEHIEEIAHSKENCGT